MIDIRHAATRSLFANHPLRRTLGANKKHRAAIGDHTAYIVHGIAKQRQRRLKVDNMNFSTFAENVGGHFRVPVAGLVTKVHAGFQHLAHSDICHLIFSKSG